MDKVRIDLGSILHEIFHSDFHIPGQEALAEEFGFKL